MELITYTTLDAQLAEIGDMLHRIHVCQRGLSAARLPTAAKYLSPRQQAMTSLAMAQNGLEGAELALIRLVSALDLCREVGGELAEREKGAES